LGGGVGRKKATWRGKKGEAKRGLQREEMLRCSGGGGRQKLEKQISELGRGKKNQYQGGKPGKNGERGEKDRSGQGRNRGGGPLSRKGIDKSITRS